MEIAYVVDCTIDDPSVADEWVTWMQEGHMADVVRAGARHASLMRLRGGANRFEVRYIFPSTEAFDGYEQGEGVRLREEGRRLFPTERGVRYERRVGAIETALGREDN